MRSDQLYVALLESHPYPHNAVVIEVGSKDGAQAQKALELGFTTHVWEPNPGSHARIVRRLGSYIARKKATVNQQAASDVSGLSVPFPQKPSAGNGIGAATNPGSVNVQTVALDDLSEFSDDVFFLKIDVQGHEARVLQGISRSIKQHKFQYIMLEFWPTEMELPQHLIEGERCTAAAALHQLVAAGYVLFEMAVKSRHWAETELPLTGERFARPLNFDGLCEWYKRRGVEHKQPTQMGYWADVLAVAPGASFEPQLAAVLHKGQSQAQQELQEADGCKFVPNHDIGKGSGRKEAATNKEACCKACKQDSTCVAATLVQGSCWLKDDVKSKDLVHTTDVDFLCITGKADDKLKTAADVQLAAARSTNGRPKVSMMALKGYKRGLSMEDGH